MLTALKIFQVKLGPYPDVLLPYAKRFPKERASSPIDPVSVNLGYNSAVAEPTRADCAANWRSARRTSGLFLRTSAGPPTATPNDAFGRDFRLDSSSFRE